MKEERKKEAFIEKNKLQRHFPMKMMSHEGLVVRVENRGNILKKLNSDLLSNVLVDTYCDYIAIFLQATQDLTAIM